MRAIIIASVCLLACAAPAVGSGAGSASATPPQDSARTSTPACERTTTRDASGVFTTNGVVGVVGVTFTSTADMALNEPLLIVRRGTTVGEIVTLRFDNLGPSAPASWVQYGATALANPNPWGEYAFAVGWKPIGFANSCWRLVVNESDSGLVLHVGP